MRDSLTGEAAVWLIEFAAKFLVGLLDGVLLARRSLAGGKKNETRGDCAAKGTERAEPLIRTTTRGVDVCVAIALSRSSCMPGRPMEVRS